MSVTTYAYHRDGSHKIFVPDHAAKLRLIKAGIGWGRISERELDKSDDLVVIEHEIVEHVLLNFCLMRAKLKPIGATARAIWAAFENHYGSRGQVLDFLI